VKLYFSGGAHHSHDNLIELLRSAGWLIVDPAYTQEGELIDWGQAHRTLIDGQVEGLVAEVTGGGDAGVGHDIGLAVAHRIPVICLFRGDLNGLTDKFACVHKIGYGLDPGKHPAREIYDQDKPRIIQAISLAVSSRALKASG